MSLKIGILVSEPQLRGEVWRNCAAIAWEDAQRRQLLDYEIEFIEETAEGLPTGSADSVIDAWKRLADQGVIAVVGPATADNAVAVSEVASEYGVPTISTTSTSYVSSNWCFSVSWGSAPEEAFRMVDWLKAQKCSSMGIIWDTMWHSGEFVEFLDIAGKRSGIRVTADERVSMRILDPGKPTDLQISQCREALKDIRATNPDSLAVATTLASAAVGEVLSEMDWDIPVVCNISLAAGLRPGKANENMAGWVGASIYDERNVLAQDFMKTYNEKFGEIFSADFQLSTYDAFRILFEGMSLAPIMLRRGVREGLEKVRMFPSCCGSPGTYLGYGTYDHRGLKGKEMIVLRRLLHGGTWERVDDIPYVSLSTS